MARNRRELQTALRSLQQREWSGKDSESFLINPLLINPLVYGAVLDNTVYPGWQNEAKALSFNGKTARSSD